MTFVRCGSPFAMWNWRTSFQAASTDSEPPLVKKTWSSPAGAIDASLAASSNAGGCAVPQLVANASWVS
jgi:hypothetical protein